MARLKDDANLSFAERWKWITESQLIGIAFGVLLNTVVVSCALWSLWHDHAEAGSANVVQPSPPPPPPPRRPNLFIRLDGAEGVDPCASLPVPPVFHLAVDADGIPPGYRSCSGGGKMLRVSYHGIVLAWGHVPCFCVERNQSGKNSVDGVAIVDAKAEGAVLREEVRSLIRSELDLLGKAVFDVDGEVAGLGYLHCQTSLFKGNAKEESCRCRCLIQ